MKKDKQVTLTKKAFKIANFFPSSQDIKMFKILQSCNNPAEVIKIRLKT